MEKYSTDLHHSRGFISLLSSALILGFFGVLIRELAPFFSDSGQVFARSLMATLIIVAIILYKKINPLSLESKDIKWIVLFSIAFASSIISFTISANLIKVANALFMLYVGSLISTAFIGKLFFKEVISYQRWISLAIVILGLAFFVYPFNLDALSIGVIAGISAGFLEGAAHSLRKIMSDVKREIVVFYQSFSGVVLSTILLYFSSEIFVKEWSLYAIFIALIFGFLLVVIGYLLAYGFSNFDVSLGSIILSTELIFALIVASIFLHEFPTRSELLGGFLIFVGTSLASVNFSKISLENIFSKKE